MDDRNVLTRAGVSVTLETNAPGGIEPDVIVTAIGGEVAFVECLLPGIPAELELTAAREKTRRLIGIGYQLGRSERDG